MVFLAIILTMFTAATVHSALAWWLLITAFTNSGATPAVVDALAHTAVWYKAVGATMFALNVLIADCVFVSKYVTRNGSILTVLLDLAVLDFLG